MRKHQQIQQSAFYEINRREMLHCAAGGVGSLALTWMLERDARASISNPLTPKKGHHRATATNVIFMFMVGGPSQIDLFDPKPEMERWRGKPLPESTGRPKSQFTTGNELLLPSTRRFRRHGQSGMWMSDLLPKLSTQVDSICYLRSCWSNSTVHAPAMYELHGGRTFMGLPSLGSWVTYGLGSVNENLPAYCVLPQPEGVPEGGAPCWSAGFLPAVYQGTLFRKGKNPILNLAPPPGMGGVRQQKTFDFIRELNREEIAKEDTDLQARIASYELAFRMQSSAPEAVDLSQEDKKTQTAYGLDQPLTADFGTRLLLARRLIERGVRFVSVYSGGGPLVTQWDAHDDINLNHERMCARVDQPIAALLADLQQRGLLESTLVVWCSEFGRTPYSQGGRGRDHNPTGFTMWLAGGGVIGGQAIGSTDEFGLKAIEKPISVHDFHATILYLLGIDHEKLTFRQNSRDERLTDVAGIPIEQVFHQRNR